MKTVGTHIGNLFAWARDGVARVLIRLHVTPNVLTILGMIVTLGAAVLMGFGQWLYAACALVAAGACDMLDGAVARIGGRKTAFGGVLDSTCDRVGDIALLSSLGIYYLATWPERTGQPANLTYGLLAVLAVIHVTLISYIRARAEDVVAHCEVGFWKRGERYACMVIGLFAANPAMILWQLGLWTAPTALYRLICARRAILGSTVPNAQRTFAGRLAFFDEPRGTWAYDLYTGTAIALLLFVRVPETDLLRALFASAAG